MLIIFLYKFLIFPAVIRLKGPWHNPLKTARNNLNQTKCLRAASPKYQLDLEIAKKSNFFELAQNEALRALVTKISF